MEELFRTPPVVGSEKKRAIHKKKRPPRTTPKKWNGAGSRAGSRGSASRGKGRAQQQQQQQPIAAADERSRRSEATDGDQSGGAPTSVLISSGISLTRDLSDLSGSYLNGNTTTSKQHGRGVPPNIYSNQNSDQGGMASPHRPWRQAKILSSREPIHPQPPTDCDDSCGKMRQAAAAATTSFAGENGGTYDVEVGSEANSGEGGIEVVKHQDISIGSSLEVDHSRFPLIVLLMDPGRKTYELLQIWIDKTDDTVRDVLVAVQKNLGDAWRQDYDGLFQFRNRQFSQLIHVLNVSTYDVQPYEVWVAKPWSMAAKATVAYATTALIHLQILGAFQSTSIAANAAKSLLQPQTPTDSEPQNQKTSGNPQDKSNDSLWVLSREARSRIYVPGGVLKHYHACQFLSFSPPFELPVRVDVLGDEASLLSSSCCSASEDNINNSKSGTSSGFSKPQQQQSQAEAKPEFEVVSIPRTPMRNSHIADTSHNTTMSTTPERSPPSHSPLPTRQPTRQPESRSTSKTTTTTTPPTTTKTTTTPPTTKSSVTRHVPEDTTTLEENVRQLDLYMAQCQQESKQYGHKRALHEDTDSSTPRSLGSSTGSSGTRIHPHHGSSSPRTPLRIVRALSVLNCASVCRRRPVHDASNDADFYRTTEPLLSGTETTVQDSEVGAIWNVYEGHDGDEESSSIRMEQDSIVSESAPLLMIKPLPPGWSKTAREI